MGGQRLRQLDGVFIDPFASVKYICQHLDGGSFSPDLPQMELQGAAGGHLEVLQQVPESCIRKIMFIYVQDSSYAPRSQFPTTVEPAAPRSIFLYRSRARGAKVPSGKFVRLVITSARTYTNFIIFLISKQLCDKTNLITV